MKEERGTATPTFTYLLYLEQLPCEEEEAEIAEARREEEERRAEKYRKMEEERETMRQGIRDKVQHLLIYCT